MPRSSVPPRRRPILVAVRENLILPPRIELPAQQIALDEAQAWPPVFESIAGRLARVELTPFTPDEIGPSRLDDLWLRGGYPDGGIREAARSPRWQRDDLLGRPWVGASWAGFVIEQILAALLRTGRPFEPWFFRTCAVATRPPISWAPPAASW